MAKSTTLLNAVWKSNSAPGATSCTICNIARPSSIQKSSTPQSLDSPLITVTPVAGKSPLRISAAAPPRML